MNGLAVLAESIDTGRIFGIHRGIRLVEAERTLGHAPAETRHGKGDSSLLHQDYGLLEITYKNPPEWVCAWVTISTHRLAHGSVPGGTVAQRLEQQFPRYVQWSDLQPLLREGGSAIQEGNKSGEYQQYRDPRSRVCISVIEDDRFERDEYFPGNGDVWSIQLEPITD